MNIDLERFTSLLKQFSSILESMKEYGINAPETGAIKESLQKHSTALKEKRQIFAVTGTMKAGKSTTLNAIIGEDLLPSRERAMTALPTLIKHVPSSSSPTLHLPAAREYNTILAENRDIFREKAKKADLPTARILNNLVGHNAFQDVYPVGEIKRILSLVNDLIRESIKVGYTVQGGICQETGSFPYVETSLDMFNDSDSPSKNIWLMDTPGPNEAGMDNIGNSLDKYLAGISGLILVIDYNQQNSEAFADLLQRIDEKNSELIENTYVFLNKVDNRRSNDCTLEENLKAISGQIFNSRIPISKIFPVSAKRAFLGMMAKKQLTQGKQAEDLGADFWHSVLGDMWEDEYLTVDKDRCISYAEKLYDRSGMEKALKGVFIENIATFQEKRTAAILHQIYGNIGRSGDLLNEARKRAEKNILEKCLKAKEAEKKVKDVKSTLMQLSSIIDSIPNRLKVALLPPITPRYLVYPDIKNEYWYSMTLCENKIGEVCQTKIKQFNTNFRNYAEKLYRTGKTELERIQMDLNKLIQHYILMDNSEKEEVYIRFDFNKSLPGPRNLISSSDYGDYIKKTTVPTTHISREGITGWIGDWLDDIIENDWGKERHHSYDIRYEINAPALNECLERKAAQQLDNLHETFNNILVNAFMTMARNALRSLSDAAADADLQKSHKSALQDQQKAESGSTNLNKLWDRYNELAAQLKCI